MLKEVQCPKRIRIRVPSLFIILLLIVLFPSCSPILRVVGMILESEHRAFVPSFCPFSDGRVVMTTMIDINEHDFLKSAIELILMHQQEVDMEHDRGCHRDGQPTSNPPIPTTDNTCQDWLVAVAASLVLEPSLQGHGNGVMRYSTNNVAPLGQTTTIWYDRLGLSWSGKDIARRSIRAILTVRAICWKMCATCHCEDYYYTIQCDEIVFQLISVWIHYEAWCKQYMPFYVLLMAYNTTG